ncbi:MAG: HEAT repeat domain-containing protein [Gemmatimonadota bacterium]
MMARGWGTSVGLVLALWAGLAACENYDPQEDVNHLKSQQAEVREKAAGRLVRRGEEVVLLLLPETRSEYTRVRFEVARLLGRIRDPRATEALVAMLDDKSANVWQMAAWALSELRAAEAVPKLLENTHSVSKGVRAEAVRGLGLCYSDTVWGALRDSIQGQVLAALQDPVSEVRIAALLSARELGYGGASDQVIRMTRDPSDEVRYVAVQALGQLATGDTPRSVGPVSERVRASIVEALVAELDEPLQSIRTKAVRSLEQIGAPEAAPHLERLRSQGTAEDVREAGRVLEKLGAAGP